MKYLFLALLLTQAVSNSAEGASRNLFRSDLTGSDQPSGAPETNASETVRPKVSLTTLDNRQLAGTLEALDLERVIIATESGTETIELRHLMMVSMTENIALPPSASAVRIELTDGSQIVATGFAVANQTAKLQVGDHELTVPIELLRAARFRPASTSVTAQWKKILASDSASDSVVLRRENNVLDHLPGIIGNIGKDTVAFELEGEIIQVKRAKLEGVIFFQRPNSNEESAVCTIQDVSGATWKARSVRLESENLRIVTGAGYEHSIPFTQILQIDFGSGNVVFLSDLEPESIEWSPYIADPNSKELLSRLYTPRRDRGFHYDKLWIGEGRHIKKYNKGLAIHSRTRMVYRLTAPYRHLTAEVGIDSRSLSGGNVELVISGDNRELFRSSIAGTDAPQTIDLDIEGISRLTILVDYGESGDIGDHLNLCDARILK